MKLPLFLSAGLLCFNQAYSLPVLNKEGLPDDSQVEWYKLPAGVYPQSSFNINIKKPSEDDRLTGVQVISDSDGFRFLVGLVKQNTGVILNVWQDDVGPTIHLYDLASKTSYPLGETSEYCMRAYSVAVVPDEQGFTEDVVAGIRIAKTGKNTCADDTFTPVIWQGGQWNELDTDRFSLKQGVIASPYLFAKKNPRWLIGRGVDTIKNNHQNYVLVWKFDAYSGRYESYAKLPVSKGYGLVDIADFSEDGHKIILEVFNQAGQRFTQEYWLNGDEFQSVLPLDYQNRPLGFYSPLNVTLVFNEQNKAGGYINQTGQLSNPDLRLFTLPDIPVGHINAHSDQGMIVLNTIAGYGTSDMGPATIFQYGVTVNSYSSPAFIPVPDYFKQYCQIYAPFAQCKQGFLKVTAFNGSLALGDCWDENIKSVNTGFYSLDLNSCPNIRRAYALKGHREVR